MPNPPYPLNPQPLRKSWIEQHPYAKIALGLLLLFVLMGSFIVILFTIILSSFHGSEVYQQAIARARTDPQVVQELGEPVRPGWLILGELKTSNDTGKADLQIPISGPRGKAQIRAIAEKSEGVWRFSCLQVVVGGKDPIDLLKSSPPG